MTDCIVVGGGLIGMLTARRLHDAGLGVRVFERGELGREASWAAGGILSPLYPWRAPAAVDRMAQASQGEYAGLAKALGTETGIDPQWRQCGMLVLDAGEAQAAARWGAHADHAIDALSGADLHSQEPALGPGFEDALWLPGVAQIRPPRLLQALRASLAQRGVTCHEHTAVTHLLTAEDCVTGVATASGTYPASRVVIAGGAWSPGLMPPGAAGLRIAPVRGQMIVFRGKPELLRSIVLHQGRYVIPRADGRVLAGSTLEQAGFEKATTEAALESLRAAAVERVPELAELRIEHHWAGLRPGALAGIPFVGEHPRVRGLWVNAGHFRNGVTLAPASARLVCDLIVGSPPSLAPEPYGVDAPRRRDSTEDAK